MPYSIIGKPGPQFSTAEYETPPGIDACKFCRRPVGALYYRIKSAMACGECVAKLQWSKTQDSHSAFVRALVFGIGGAIVGLVLYAAVELVTGIVIGYMSLGVGFLVAKAMMLGSKGVGGRRYQITAAVLTYAAVSMAAIPVALVPMIRNHSQQQVLPSQQNPQQQTAEQEPQEKPGFGKALGVLALIGLASPFLELTENTFYGIIGLIILFVGIQIAWRMTAGKQFDIFGPFQNAPQKAP